MDNKILRMNEVCRMVSLSRSTIYRLIKSEQFPRQVQISERLIGFRLSEISEWIESR